MTASQIITGPGYARCADATISPPDVPTVWKGETEWNPIKFSVERHTRFLEAEKASIEGLRGKQILFCYSDYMESFFHRILPKLPGWDYVLIFHGDVCFTADYFGFLDDPKVKHVFSTNCQITHPKLTPIPLGVPPDQVQALLDVMALRPLDPRIPKIYANFNLLTNRRRAGILERLLKREDVTCDTAKNVPLAHYAKQSCYEYVLSPPGAGPDCFRTWEALYLGQVPIVERWVQGSPYSGFSIIEVDDLGNPPKTLHDPRKYYCIPELLTLNHWHSVIKSAL